MKKQYQRGGVLGALLATILFLATACETVQTTQSGVVGVDRSQRMAISSTEIDKAATQQYAQLIAQEQKKGNLNRNAAQVNRVRAISNRLIQQVTAFRPDARNWRWEMNVLSSAEVNAWCMPGGKIAVYTGLMEKLNVTDDELAAVLGHEMAHALREHARERASEQAIAGMGIQIISAIAGLGDLGAKGMEYAYMGLLGLPNSRGHETEADRIGVELAARAGYDPRAAITLWQKMGAVGNGGGPKFLSTHPPREDRISDLTAYSAKVMPLYQQARR
ncbi:MAG: M48 family metallopeptidase [Lacisediminimonas sp.]|nr:M48 family metallopeptidase [Lacisediminimonas sp.]